MEKFNRRIKIETLQAKHDRLQKEIIYWGHWHGILEVCEQLLKIKENKDGKL